MKTKEIYGIIYEVIDFKEGDNIIMPGKNVYLEANIVKTGSIECNNLYVKGDQIVEGYQRVKGYQIVEGDQRVEGYQIVEGYQRVEGIVINSYCKWRVIVYAKTIKIGCHEKQTKEWKEFFKNKQSFETKSDSYNYLKIHSAFKMAIVAQQHLKLMNKNANKIIKKAT